MNDDKNMDLNEEDVVINPNNYAKYGIKKEANSAGSHGIYR